MVVTGWIGVCLQWDRDTYGVCYGMESGGGCDGMEKWVWL